MGKELPPKYPYPDDRILWSSHSDGFEPGKDSYIALAELPETDLRIFNGREHKNPYRLVIHTPVRGSTAMFVNEGDLEALLALATVGLANDDSGMFGSAGIFELYDDWLEIYSGVDVNFITDND